MLRGNYMVGDFCIFWNNRKVNLIVRETACGGGVVSVCCINLLAFYDQTNCIFDNNTLRENRKTVLEKFIIDIFSAISGLSTQMQWAWDIGLGKRKSMVEVEWDCQFAFISWSNNLCFLTTIPWGVFIKKFIIIDISFWHQDCQLGYNERDT